MISLDAARDALKEHRSRLDEQHDLAILAELILPDVYAFDRKELDACGQLIFKKLSRNNLRRISVGAGSDDDCVLCRSCEVARSFGLRIESRHSSSTFLNVSFGALHMGQQKSSGSFSKATSRLYVQPQHPHTYLVIENSFHQERYHTAIVTCYPVSQHIKTMYTSTEGILL